MYSPKSIYCSYAFEVICSYVKTGKKPNIDKYREILELKNKRGCFVSIHKKGELRGCIGTIIFFPDIFTDQLIFVGFHTLLFHLIHSSVNELLIDSSVQ